MDIKRVLEIVFPKMELDLELTPDVRLMKDLRGLTYNDIPDRDEPIYYMYRSLYIDGDRERFEGNHIRHDVTVIPPNSFQGELVKTVGHFHPARNERETFPEYYEVLQGEALYFLQKNTEDNDVEEAIFIRAKAGDKVFVPPNYGHVTINPCKETLVMANLVEANFKSLYAPIQEKKGPAFFCIMKDDEIEFIANPNYSNRVTPLVYSADEWEEPVQMEAGKRLYEMYLGNPKLFNFLK
ncbi:MAG: glucose-6-phosphate isomerase [Clostridia bacterium]|nr:glucose-6-phosphate isomerase [Clostridia bacterium]